MTEGAGYAAAVVLAALFLRASAAKLARPDQAVRSFTALGLPAAATLARAVPAVELALAVALLAAPRVGGGGALALLAAFSAVLARAVRAGATTPCACFGTAATDPVSALDIVRNGFLAMLAIAAMAATRPVVPGPGGALGVAAAVAGGFGVLAVARRRRRGRA